MLKHTFSREKLKDDLQKFGGLIPAINGPGYKAFLRLGSQTYVGLTVDPKLPLEMKGSVSVY